jgi:hypothetical protein
MTFDLNERIAPNFTLREVVEWPKHQTMTPGDRALATELAYKALKPVTYANAQRVAKDLQVLCVIVNKQFPQFGGRIGVRALSWLRHQEWEMRRGRSGNSQHVHGHAVDFIVTNCGADTNKVMEWLFNHLSNWNGGLARMIRNGNYSFIHIDLGPRRRWEY